MPRRREARVIKPGSDFYGWVGKAVNVGEKNVQCPPYDVIIQFGDGRKGRWDKPGESSVIVVMAKEGEWERVGDWSKVRNGNRNGNRNGSRNGNGGVK